jgi:peptide/nickel transport system substrate-binding protein
LSIEPPESSVASQPDEPASDLRRPTPVLSRSTFLRGAAATLLIGAGSACSTPSAGGTGRAAPPSTPTGQLVVGVEQKPQSLDPARATGVTTYTINQNVYEGLTMWDQDKAAPVPALAMAWSANEDATVWTFKLRPGVRFHDGQALTSTAVKKSFEHYRDGVGSFLGSYAGEFTSIDDSDPATAVIHYAKPYPDLARNAPILGIISPKGLVGTADEVTSRLQNTSYGAGAFRFTSGISGSTLALAANESYWGPGPYLRTLRIQTIPDESARIAALQAGNLDVVLQVSALPRKQLAADHRFTLSSGPTWSQFRVIFACDRPPFTDVRARQAVAYALDPQIMADKLYLGQAKPGKGLMPTGCYGYSTPGVQYPHDVAKARALWSATGHNAKISVAYSSSLGVSDQQRATVIASQLNAAGIATRVVGLNDTQVGNELHSKKHLYDLSLATFSWINGGPFFYTPGVFSDTQSARYTGADVNDLQRRQNSVADGPARLALLRRLQETAEREMFVDPLLELVNTDACAKNVHGHRTTKDAFMYRFAQVYRG